MENLASKGMGTGKIAGKSHQGSPRRGTVAGRSGGFVRPVRWPTHWLGLLPSSPPSLGHTLISPSTPLSSPSLIE